MLRRRGLWLDEIKVLGHVNQAELKNIMSISHVLVLPSVQDGFGMVMAQAMACGCPVIATHNTGAADLFTDGQEGYIVPIRDVDALAKRMQFLADNPDIQVAMADKAMLRVQKLGGWHGYGEQAVTIYENC
jgi:glycosyltransferase involved in cell wall biosynthesis